MNEADLNEACSEIAAPGSPVVRDYSASPSDCLDLIAAMLRKGWEMHVLLDDGEWCASFERKPGDTGAIGETFPLAVCRAAVAAMDDK